MKRGKNSVARNTIRRLELLSRTVGIAKELLAEKTEIPHLWEKKEGTVYVSGKNLNKIVGKPSLYCGINVVCPLRRTESFFSPEKIIKKGGKKMYRTIQ